jgi:hypothetical protein
MAAAGGEEDDHEQRRHHEGDALGVEGEQPARDAAGEGGERPVEVVEQRDPEHEPAPVDAREDRHGQREGGGERAEPGARVRRLLLGALGHARPLALRVYT